MTLPSPPLLWAFLLTAQVNKNVPIVAAGTSFDLAVGFIDQGSTPLEGLISWGDGSTATVPVTVSNQQGQFDTTHVYAKEGSYPLTVMVVDAQGIVVGVGALPVPCKLFPLVLDRSMSFTACQGRRLRKR